MEDPYPVENIDRLGVLMFQTSDNSQLPTCSTLIFFLSFAQISLISKNLIALTLSLIFSKIECAPDHHSLIKSALFFHSFFAIFFFKLPMITRVLNGIIWYIFVTFGSKIPN